jgi:mannose-6-phosphate isomerase-like protein (cupin superfamily)
VTARAGQVIHNPATGETVTFLVTAAGSGGRLLRVDMTAERSSAPTHLHPKMTETWDLKEGTLHLEVRGQEHVLEGPARHTVPAAAPHRFWSDGPIHTVTDFEPALRFEDFLVTIYSLAAAGKTNKQGMPNLLRSAVIAQAYRDEYALPFPPLPVQRVLFALLAPLGRLLGYKPTYP